MLTFFLMEALIWDDFKNVSLILFRITEMLTGSIGKFEQNIYLPNRRFCFAYRLDMTIAVDWGVKQQTKQAGFH